MTVKVTIPVSVGELIDKITILEIKSTVSENQYIHKELEELNNIKSTLTQYLFDYEVQLKKVNQTLWEIEDRIRQKEKNQEFDGEFIELARKIYINNDKRAEIKKRINDETNSEFKEIKVF